MPTIEEKRRLLDAKLKEMAQDGVTQGEVSAVQDFVPPQKSLSRRDGNTQSAAKGKPYTAAVEKSAVGTDLEAYRNTYFQANSFREKTSFTMNTETLRQLRNVLNDLEERVAMAAYIDNIIREHLKQHRDLLNEAAAKNRRKTTITI